MHANAEQKSRYQRARDALVDKLRKKGITHESVLSVIQNTPRHCFLDPILWHRAYDDNPLPIIARQTISQPYIVALMTQSLIEHAPSTDKVLELGTGSGYQSYILAQLFATVYTIERIEPLYSRAQKTLHQLGCANITCAHNDGQAGWLEYQPFPAILVTAALTQIPDTLVKQLSPDGVLIAPVGTQSDSQKLVMIQKTQQGLHTQYLESVRFVPVLSGTQ